MKLVLAGLALIVSCAIAQAEERISALDFGLSFKDHIGKSATVDGCQFVQAMIDRVSCRIVVNNNTVGLFQIETKAVPRALLKKLILDCAQLEFKPECRGSVSGTLEDNGYNEFTMRDAQITLPN